MAGRHLNGGLESFEKAQLPLECRSDAVDDDSGLKLSWAEWLIDKRLGELL